MGFGDALANFLGVNNTVGTGDPMNALVPQQNVINTDEDMLNKMAQGQGPNPAQLQYMQNVRNITANQAQSQNQNRSLNPAAAAKNASNAAANAELTAAGESQVGQAAQQVGAINSLGSLALGNMGAINQASNIGAQIGMQNQQGAQGLVGGTMQGLGSLLNIPGFNKVGMSGYYDGGSVSDQNQGQGPVNTGVGNFGFGMGNMFGNTPGNTPSVVPGNAPSSNYSPITNKKIPKSQVGQNFQNPSGTGAGALEAGMASIVGSGGNSVKNIFSSAQDAANTVGSVAAVAESHGGIVPAMVSPGEKYLNPKEAQNVASGKDDIDKDGVRFKGKSKVRGDSPKNDTIPAGLDEGGVVIPKTVMNEGKESAIKFVVNELSKHGKSPEGEFHEALRRAVKGRKNK